MRRSSQAAGEAFRASSAVVLLSDGDWNTGDPPAAGRHPAPHARTRLSLPCPLGSEARLPDVELSSFDVPTFAVAGKPLRIPFTIESSLPQR